MTKLKVSCFAEARRERRTWKVKSMYLPVSFNYL